MPENYALMPESLEAKQDKTAIATNGLMPMNLEAPAESTMVNSILNNESLSIEQKRKLLEERMANLPPEQREMLEAQKHMSEWEYVWMGASPLISRYFTPKLPKSFYDKIKAINKTSLFEAFTPIVEPVKNSLAPFAKQAKDEIYQNLVKEGIIQGTETVKELPKTIKDKEQELEWETRKLLSPKIPYVDY